MIDKGAFDKTYKVETVLLLRLIESLSIKKDLAGAAPYTYLGTARYVSHYGSRPMSITWHLDHPIPAKYIKKTSKADVG